LYHKTEGFDSTQTTCVDADIIFKLEEITSLKYINIPLYYYRVHKEGVSKKYYFKNQLQQYISKLNAYKRRLNSETPNLNLNDLIKLYYKFTFYDIIKLCKIITIFFNLYRLKDLMINIFPSSLIFQIRNKYKILRQNYFFWFDFKKVF
jgi:hypothetical protein